MATDMAINGWSAEILPFYIVISIIYEIRSDAGPPAEVSDSVARGDQVLGGYPISMANDSGLSQRVGYGHIKSYAVDSDEKKSLPFRLLMFQSLISCFPRSVTPLGNAQPANRNRPDARPPYVTSSAAVALAPPALIFSTSQRFTRSRRQAVTMQAARGRRRYRQI